VSIAEPRPLPASDPAGALRAPEVEAIVRSLETKVSAPSAVIERVVHEELQRFRDARVRNFVAILVERAAAHRLGSLTPVSRVDAPAGGTGHRGLQAERADGPGDPPLQLRAPRRGARRRAPWERSSPFAGDPAAFTPEG
jgi:hypothetical protein